MSDESTTPAPKAPRKPRKPRAPKAAPAPKAPATKSPAKRASSTRVTWVRWDGETTITITGSDARVSAKYLRDRKRQDADGVRRIDEKRVVFETPKQARKFFNDAFNSTGAAPIDDGDNTEWWSPDMEKAEQAVGSAFKDD